MSDIFKGLTGGGWAGLLAWILPSALTLGLFWLLVYQEMDTRYALFDTLAATEKAGVWLAASVTLGLFLNALSTPMYRLLEGYMWPQGLRQRGVSRQRKKKAKLEHSLDGEGWERGLQDEQLARFPRIDSEIAPTQLGNALRAFETYGATRFGLDSQTLWSELCSVVPKYLQDELSRSRASVDFFVALFYLSGAFGMATIFSAFLDGCKWTFTLGAIIAFSSMILWYRMAIVSTSYWSRTVQALVNLGRFKLADAMGLEIPNGIEAEREMWHDVSRFVYDNERYAPYRLDKFRKRPANEHKNDSVPDDASDDDEKNKGVASEPVKTDPTE